MTFNEIKEMDAVLINELTSDIIHRYENSGRSAEDFFDEEELRACDFSNTLAYIVNYIGVKLYGTMPMNNNPFLEI